MSAPRWTLRLGILGVISVAVVTISACRDAGKDGTAGTTSAAPVGAAPAPVSGGHSNEEFCKLLLVQFDQMSKFDPSNVATRTTYFAGQKEMNAKLVKAAPPALASDIALQTTNANAAIDAQLAGDPARIKATRGPITSPEHFAAARRMNAYCGIKVDVSR